MLIFPAIDLVDGKAVRLFKGDYAQMTVYNEDPVQVALDFRREGAGYIHIVDLEGAKSGLTPNFETVCAIKQASGLFCEVGGGIRNMQTVKKYIEAGIDRVILGTAAVTDERFLREAVASYGDRISVGIDLKDGYVAIRGWTSRSEYTLDTFCKKMQSVCVSHIICTDISKDGAMQGTNHALYESITNHYHMKLTASGGVSSIEDIRRLREKNVYAAIIGKAYYTGALDLREAIEVASE